MIDYFIPSEEEPTAIPLIHHLEPMPRNVVSRYIEAYTEPQGFVLDPFCQTPVVIEEAHRKGRSALAAHFNPVNFLLARGLLGLPPPREIDAASLRLGDAPKLGLPLREHINQLYTTLCYHCRKPVIAQEFVWDRERGLPKEKNYQCPNCGAEGPFPVEKEDLETLARVRERGVHYWYLLDRLTSPGDEERELAQSLLELYTPRNLYALVNLSMKVEALFSDSPLLETLQLILLLCFDSCRKVERDKGAPARLRPPREFIERNVWSAFEEAYRQVRALGREEEGAMAESQKAITKRSVKDLAKGLERGSVDLIITTPPPHDRPFWALSYLWSGWLFGKEETTAFMPFLRPRQLDWSWYQRALAPALRALTPLLRPQARVVFILERGNARRMESVGLACAEAGLSLENILLQPYDLAPVGLSRKRRKSRYRLSFIKSEGKERTLSPARLASRMRKQALGACKLLLQERSAPLLFEWLQAAIFKRWSEEGLLQRARRAEGVSLGQLAEEEIEKTLQQGLTSGRLILLDDEGERREANEVDRASSLWWLGREKTPPRLLCDQIEEAARQTLQELKNWPTAREEVYSLFPGFLTPDPGLAEGSLRAYGQESLEEWSLRPQGAWPRREEIVGLLLRLGERLGFEAWAAKDPQRKGKLGFLSLGQAYFDVVWQEGGTPACILIIRSTAALRDLYLWAEKAGGISHLVIIPDELAPLLDLKLQGNILIRKKLLDEGWDSVKFGHLQTLMEQEEIDRYDLRKIVGLLPPIESPEAQLPLFP